MFICFVGHGVSIWTYVSFAPTSSALSPAPSPPIYNATALQHVVLKTFNPVISANKSSSSHRAISARDSRSHPGPFFSVSGCEDCVKPPGWFCAISKGTSSALDMAKAAATTGTKDYSLGSDHDPDHDDDSVETTIDDSPCPLRCPVECRIEPSRMRRLKRQTFRGRDSVALVSGAATSSPSVRGVWRMGYESLNTVGNDGSSGSPRMLQTVNALPVVPPVWSTLPSTRSDAVVGVLRAAPAVDTPGYYSTPREYVNADTEVYLNASMGGPKRHTSSRKSIDSCFGARERRFARKCTVRHDDRRIGNYYNSLRAGTGGGARSRDACCLRKNIGLRSVNALEGGDTTYGTVGF
ncbi:hypothetical protein C8R44DRAFT_920284 [Mycena epipterygia]|nr:hypothetical protein C8R44DRAFT_920284 [Mycena epipterygia]